MSDKPKNAFEGTIDSVTATVGFLWDLLSAPAKPESQSEILDMLPDSIPAKKDNQIPAQVIDTEGEDA